jgi:hypothetical protein
MIGTLNKDLHMSRTALASSVTVVAIDSSW